MYTMMQVCRKLNMSYQTLKYYCNEGLVPNVKRDKNNRRIFDESDLNWIKDLSCLKKCNFSINEMKMYLDLCLKGPSTIEQRQSILEEKRKSLLKSIEELNNSIEYINWKQEFYNDVLYGNKPYISNLIKSE
ncbi:MAG: MerR family transcriptional regulator [Lachnospirales bacterium]